MNEKEKVLKEIIKRGVEKDMSRFDDLAPISDDELKRSGQEPPDEKILENIKKKAKEGGF